MIKPLIYYNEVRAILCAVIQRDGTVLVAQDEGSRTLYSIWVGTNAARIIVKIGDEFYLFSVHGLRINKARGAYTRQYYVFKDKDAAITAGIMQTPVPVRSNLKCR